MPFPFTEVCILLQRHEDIETGRPPILHRDQKEARLRAVTESWFKSHRSAIGQLDADSSVALLSTLLPERRTDRVYNIRAARLVHILSRSLGLSASLTRDLHAHDRPGHGDLAQCLERVLTSGGPPARPPVTVDEVDHMLRFLAGGCIFSDPNIQRIPPGSSEARDTLIGNLLKRLSPNEAKWLVRLILKDFTPVRLNETHILKSHHFLLPGILRFQDHFDAALGLLKGALNEYPNHPDPRSERLHFQSAAKYLKPTVGVKVGRPNFHKARGIDHCIRMLGETRWVLERKYDGEYCEVHVDLANSKTPAECITIFSKSGKNSTADRQSLLPTLVDTLRLGKQDCKINRQAILLGEMVVYSDKDRCILPFDEIRKHVLRSGRAIGTDADSFPKAGEHLAIVFFDLLLLDDEVVMNKPVEERRQWLREVYRKISGHALGAEWKMVNFSARPVARRILMQQFAASIAQRCEGLVLKPCGVPYFSLEVNPASYAQSYIKLKKDYMTGMGDEADLAVVGGSYSAQQAASCGVPGIRWTEFHLGCLMNKVDVSRFDARPRFKVVGRIQQEHCIPKPILQAANTLGQYYAAPFKPGDSPETFDLDTMPGARIDAVFSKPFVFEVLGSGFEKPSNCNFYMLRHPRVTKLHEDRTWRDAISMQELQESAAAARSAAADSESQETRRWLDKLERKSRRKFERERTTTPKTRTTATPSTSRLSTSRTKVVSSVVRSGNCVQRSKPAEDISMLNGTTLIAEPSTTTNKRSRHENSQTPCPPAKRQRDAKWANKRNVSAVSNAFPLVDITNQAAVPSKTPASSDLEPMLLKRVSALFEPLISNGSRHPSSHCPGSSCHLNNSTVYLSPCISYTPYISHDLLSPHLENPGCAVLTRNLSDWDREANAHSALCETVSESPAYQGRRKVVLVESKRREATSNVVRGLQEKGLRETIEVWDWWLLEDEERKEDGNEWFLGSLECNAKSLEIEWKGADWL